MHNLRPFIKFISIFIVFLFIITYELQAQKAQYLFNAAEYYYSKKDTAKAIEYYSKSLDEGYLNWSKVNGMIVILACNNTANCRTCANAMRESSKLPDTDWSEFAKTLKCKVSIDSIKYLPKRNELLDRLKFLSSLDQMGRTTNFFPDGVGERIDTAYIIPSLKEILLDNKLSLESILFRTGNIEILIFHAIRLPSFYQWLKKNNIIEDLVKNGLISSFFYAIAIDNYLTSNKLPQLYGTMWGTNYMEPVEDEVNLDKRRLKIGLLPLKYDSLIAKQNKEFPKWYNDSKVNSIEFYLK